MKETHNHPHQNVVQVEAYAEPTLRQKRATASTSVESRIMPASPPAEPNKVAEVTRVEAFVEEAHSTAALFRDIAILQREVAKLRNEVDLLKGSTTSSVISASQKAD